ncbi:MAG: serine hydrolase [candidate division KSB1 bacterium]|nr:serine hydrolase [candidate division KSB1 bacterium]MDZ7369268.1 serine hydrolase [candidate division KSB1 bacterium]MDZ7407303.1 serine hydrolase [candidate division KSB1 bacterium]
MQKFLILLSCLFLSCHSTLQNRMNHAKSADQWIEKKLAQMTLREKLGQMFFYHIDTNFKTETDSSWQKIAALVKTHHLGGVHLWRGEPYATAFMTNRLQALAKIPLLFTADLEHGVARFGGTDFPPNMAIAAGGDPQQAYQMGWHTAREARSLGLHLTFAPVADVNNNPLNPIINVRSFGEDPEMVARFTEAFIRGCQAGGLLTTAKHFPGHGDTAEDSHIELAYVPADSTRLEQVELPPFHRAIAAGVDFIMTAHLNVRGVAMNPYAPATLSPEIMTGLLRQKLRFDGVLITDSMRMWALSQNYTDVFATVQAVKAGVDVILVQENIPAMIAELEKRVQSGEITMARLDESVQRLLRAKVKIGLHRQRLVNLDSLAARFATPEAKAAASTAAARAMTLLKNEKNILPLSPADSGRVVVIEFWDEPLARSLSPFVRELSRYLKNAAHDFLTPESGHHERSTILKKVRAAKAQIWAAYTPLRSWKGHLGLPENLQPLADSLLATGVPAVVVSFGNPYIYPQVQNAAAYLATFGSSEILEIAAARAVVGAVEISGKSPISIPGYFERGTGLGLAAKNFAPAPPGTLPRLRLRVGFPEEAGISSVGLDSVRRLMQNAVQDSVFPGAVLLVARNGLIVMDEAFGKMGYKEFNRAMRLDAIFDLASVTKCVATTTACMLLYERGRLDLDAPVQNYLPEFVGAGKENVTIRHLLTHSSGLMAYRRYFLEYKTPGEIIKTILNEPLENPPGAKTVYSDLGIILMGKIIEKLSGQPLDVFCREQIFKPLKMNETGYNPPPQFLSRIPPTELDSWRSRMVQGQVHDENAFALGGVSGHAGLFSTARDLATFLNMLLNGGAYEGGRLLKPETIALFTSRQNVVAGSSRALGWDTADGKNSAGRLMSGRAFGHTGFTGTSVWTDPEKNMFVILLSNRVHPTRKNQKLLSFRATLHDAVMKAVEARP